MIIDDDEFDMIAIPDHYHDVTWCLGERVHLPGLGL
jgi:hypothetical protein